LKQLSKLNIFNDPIYGFIRIPSGIVFSLIEHPYFQRLRRISQMGLSYMVYPGAHHTRFHHALGAMHLMQQSIGLLRQKNLEITTEEEQGLLCAILLHDIGHGPFSHALENELIIGVSHEELSLRIMEALNLQFNGELDVALEIFKGTYPKKYLNQLVSSQLDMDRLDYLKRDSFYTGVAEGNINSERLITMLSVHNDILAIEEKGLYSVEKFLMARRFMYWQVYLHKTSLAAEALLVRIIRRARTLKEYASDKTISADLRYFLFQRDDLAVFSDTDLKYFMNLDDVDIFSALKFWKNTKDPVLSRMCNMILERKLPSLKFSRTPISEKQLESKRTKLRNSWNLSEKEAEMFVFSGEISNRAYNRNRQNIHILLKNESLLELSDRSEHINSEVLSGPEVKYFICSPKKGVY
jgi:HD superfamily phosphohydrolase